MSPHKTRPYTGQIKEYDGSRPCIWWPPFLIRLSERGLLSAKATRTFTPPQPTNK